MTVTIDRPTSRPITRRTRVRSQRTNTARIETAPAVDHTPAVEPEILPAAVRNLLDQAKAWPEYGDYFRVEAERLLGRPIPTSHR